jgi:F0F1-type ATP synthase alpha subunit
MKLRSYKTEAHALAYARILQATTKDATFKVWLSPFAAYAFRYLIHCSKSSGIAGAAKGSWVGR